MIRTILILLSLFISSLGYSSVVEFAADKNSISVNYNFTGNKIHLYGATDIKGTIFIEIKGNDLPFILIKKKLINGFWIDIPVVRINNILGFYALLSSSNDFIYGFEKSFLNYSNIEYEFYDKSSKYSINNLIDNAIRLKKLNKEYVMSMNSVKKLGKYLFSAEINFPNNIPIGSYNIMAYVLPEGNKGLTQLKSLKSITIHRIGFTKHIYELAHNHSIIYGLLVILLSLFIGFIVGKRKF